MKRNKNPLMNALPIVAAMYSEKTGVPVKIGGDVAHTDGKSVNLPVIPDDAPQQQAIWGYLAHEGAHVRFSDFNAVRNRIHTKQQHTLVNIVEDCRIEQLMIKTYPGTEETLLETCEYMISAGHYQAPKSGDHPSMILSAYCLYYMQSKGVGQQPLLPYLAQAEAALIADFPAAFCTKLEALLDEAIVQCDSTDSAIDYANKILDLVADMVDDEPEQQDQQDGQGDQGQQGDEQNDEAGDAGKSDSEQTSGQDGNSGSSGQEADDGDEGSSSQQNQSGQTGQGQQGDEQNDSGDSGANSSEHPSEQGGDSSSSNQANGDGNSQNQGTDQSNESTPSNQHSQQSLQAMADAIMNAGESDVMGDVRDALKADLQAANQQPHENSGSLKTIAPAEDVPRGNTAAFADARSISAGIRQQLWGMVQASQRNAPRASQAGRKVIANKLARVRAGETKVFVKPAEKRQPNAAVHILVDLSSSMVANQNYMHAREAGLAIALALQSILGVNPAVTFFDTSYDGPRMRAGLKHGSRVDAACFDVYPSGSTPMAEAMWHAALEVTKCKEERKMVICITDGEPDDKLATRQVIETCEKAGVELIGIGINSTAVTQLIANSIVINGAKELRSTLFGMMREVLTAA